jgi:hypothetical protein
MVHGAVTREVNDADQQEHNDDNGSEYLHPHGSIRCSSEVGFVLSL